MITVTLYTKSNCSLCDEALQFLQELQATIPHNLALVDIDADPDLRSSFKDRVPVLQAGPYTLESPFDSKKIQMTLAAARDRQEQLANDPKFISRQERGAQMSAADRFGRFLTHHYLAALNTLLLLYVGLPFLAPVLMNAGYPALARPIYTMYGAVCHQLAFRSWFLFGEQPAYPRQAANVPGITFEQATGINGTDFIDARNFIGNQQLGYKVAFCERDVAIYASMLLFGLLYAATGRRLKPLHWVLWLLIGLGPIALDGFSQLFSQIPNWPFWVYRESTPLLRTLTGALFGFTTAWFGFPLLEESFEETRVTLATKKVRVSQTKKKK